MDYYISNKDSFESEANESGICTKSLSDVEAVVTNVPSITDAAMATDSDATEFDFLQDSGTHIPSLNKNVVDPFSLDQEKKTSRINRKSDMPSSTKLKLKRKNTKKGRFCVVLGCISYESSKTDVIFLKFPTDVAMQNVSC